MQKCKNTKYILLAYTFINFAYRFINLSSDLQIFVHCKSLKIHFQGAVEKLKKKIKSKKKLKYFYLT